jgi:hypothetical protein
VQGLGKVGRGAGAVAHSCGDLEIGDGVVEASLRESPEPECELGRPAVARATADDVLAPERLEARQGGGQLVGPVEPDRDEHGLHGAGRDEEDRP